MKCKNCANFQKKCSECAEINKNVDEIFYKRMNSCGKIYTCSDYFQDTTCSFAQFSDDESDIKCGRNMYCKFADFWIEKCTQCTCEDAIENFEKENK